VYKAYAWICELLSVIMRNYALKLYTTPHYGRKQLPMFSTCRGHP